MTKLPTASFDEPEYLDEPPLADWERFGEPTMPNATTSTGSTGSAGSAGSNMGAGQTVVVTPVTPVTPLRGAVLLAEVENYLSRFVAYPSEHARVAHVLWIGHTWFMNAWDSTPRIAFLSPEPGSGKSRALEVTEPLVPRAVHAVNATPAYLFRKVSDDAGPPTILYDEIDTVFGPKAKDNEEVRGMLNAGHRKGATAGRCVTRGTVIETEELPAYCAVALAGLDDLPDTIMTRSVVVRMRRRAPGERVEPWRFRTVKDDAERLSNSLAQWSNANQHTITARWPEMPDGVEDRNADVWEALLAVADLAGGEWPLRGRDAAVALVNETQNNKTSLGVLLLKDIRAIFNGDDLTTAGQTDRLATVELVERLNQLEESPWSNLYGKELTPNSLAQRLKKYGIAPTTFKQGHGTFKGYMSHDPRDGVGTLADAWDRYLPPIDPRTPPAKEVTEVTTTTTD